MVDAIDKTKFTSEGKTIVEYNEKTLTNISIFYTLNSNSSSYTRYNTWSYYYSISNGQPYLKTKEIDNNYKFEIIKCVELIQYDNYFVATVGIVYNNNLITNTITMSNSVGGYLIIK